MTTDHAMPQAPEQLLRDDLIDDIERLSVLSEGWDSANPISSIECILDIVLQTLSLDFIGLRFRDESDVVLRVEPAFADVYPVASLRTTLEACSVAGARDTWADIAGATLAVVQLALGANGNVGMLLAGTRRSSFPERMEQAKLQLAASQVGMVILEMRQMGTRHSQRTEETLRATEWALRESERQLQQIVSSIPGLTWRADALGNITFWSQGFLDYANAEFENILGYGFLDYIHPDDRDRTMATWVGILKSGSTGESEARLRRADGQYRWFLWRASPFFDDAGEITQWFGINVDIENRKHAEEKLRQTQSDLAHATRMTTMGELAVSIAHEVNQPLMAIVTNAGACLRWLADSHADIAMARQAAERIVRDGHRAGDIITSLRNLARKSAPRMDRVCLDEVIPVVLDLLQGELRRHGVIVRAHVADCDIAILGDSTQLQQVVLNLVMNAVEAMVGAAANPRRLDVRAETRDGTAVVSVSDTGPGLGAENADRVFDAFFSTKAEGIGMGLSICRSIIEAHGGSLWASDHQPRGSIFSFTLPLAEGNGTHVPQR